MQYAKGGDSRTEVGSWCSFQHDDHVTELVSCCTYYRVMHTSTIVLQGKVVVDNVLFSWWVTDGLAPRLTVSHPKHGTDTRALGDTEPRAQARAIAHAMLTRAREPQI